MVVDDGKQEPASEAAAAIGNASGAGGAGPAGTNLEVDYQQHLLDQDQEQDQEQDRQDSVVASERMSGASQQAKSSQSRTIAAIQ